MTREHRNPEEQPSASWKDEESGVPFDMPGEFAYLHSTATVMQIETTVYLVSQVEARTLFRNADRNEVEWTYFLYRPFDESNRASPEAHFAAEIEAGAYGRVVLYECPEPVNDLLMFCFRQDGIGTFVEYGDEVEFIYDYDWDDLQMAGNLLELPAPAFSPLCSRIFIEQVWHAMRDPYLGPDHWLEGKALEYLCGSDASLRQFTRWIFQSRPALFREGLPLTCVYRAAVDGTTGGAWVYGRPQHYVSFGSNGAQGTVRQDGFNQIKTLCELAFEYNTFTGTAWEYNDNNRNRHSGYTEYPLYLEVEIKAPSRQETQEAWRELTEWLADKVSPLERQWLLGFRP